MGRISRSLAAAAEECGLQHDKDSIYGAWRGYSLIMDTFMEDNEWPTLHFSVSRAGEHADRAELKRAFNAVQPLERQGLGKNSRPFEGCWAHDWMVAVDIRLPQGTIAKYLSRLLDEAVGILGAQGLENCDSATGAIGPTKAFRIRGKLRILSEESYQRLAEQVEEDQRRYDASGENYLAGVGGAILAALAVGLAYVVLGGESRGGVIILGLAGMAAGLAYRHLAGRVSRVTFLSAAIVPFPVAYLAVRAHFCLRLMDAWGLDFAEAFQRLDEGMREGIVPFEDYAGALEACLVMLVIEAVTCAAAYRRWKRRGTVERV